jgi:hypothetical protein
MQSCTKRIRAQNIIKHLEADQEKYLIRRFMNLPNEVDIPVSTVIAYELNGTPIPTAQVCDGIADGKLEWKDGQAALKRKTSEKEELDRNSIK